MQALFKSKTLNEKLYSPIGILLLILASVLITYIIVKLDWPYSIIVIVGLISLIILLLSVIDPKYAFFLNIIAGFALGFASKIYIQFPWGIVSNLFSAIIFFVIIIQKLRTSSLKWSKFHSPTSYAILIFIIYYFFEIINPEANSILGWAQNLREVVANIVIFYAALELFTSYKFLKEFTQVWLSCSIIFAIYGMVQEFHGLFPFEYNWLISEFPARMGLIVVDGVLRVFSGETSPTTFGIGMSMAVIFATPLLGIIKSNPYKLLMTLAILIMTVSMAYSGTRTAVAMLPAAMVFFLFINLNKPNLVLLALIPISLFVIVLILPIEDNYTLNRFRSTFIGNKDASYNGRDVNRHAIQPYMKAHPIGGGLATTNVDGQRFNPGHPLAGWNTDSGYVKIALEQGWIGLIINCVVYWMIVVTALRNYTQLRSPILKNYGIGIVMVLYTMIIAHFTQDAIYEHPNVLIFFTLAAIMVKIPEIDAQMAPQG